MDINAHNFWLILILQMRHLKCCNIRKLLHYTFSLLHLNPSDNLSQLPQRLKQRKWTYRYFQLLKACLLSLIFSDVSNWKMATLCLSEKNICLNIIHNEKLWEIIFTTLWYFLNHTFDIRWKYLIVAAVLCCFALYLLVFVQICFPKI